MRTLDTASPKGYRVSTLFPRIQPRPPTCLRGDVLLEMARLVVCYLFTSLREIVSLRTARDQQEAVSWENG